MSPRDEREAVRAKGTVMPSERPRMLSERTRGEKGKAFDGDGVGSGRDSVGSSLVGVGVSES